MFGNANSSFLSCLFLLAFAALLLVGCESANFDKDKRQIAAKNAIREMLPPTAHNFDVTAFGEDTLAHWTDTLLKHPIRYNLAFVYTDATGKVQSKSGFAVFAPDGKSLLTAQITNL